MKGIDKRWLIEKIGFIDKKSLRNIRKNARSLF